jgi:aromatic-L-amino-acid decarboxylase
VVVFRWRPPGGFTEDDLERANSRILEHVNASGEVFLSHTKLGGRYGIRLAVGNLRTEERHVRRAWELVLEGAEL